MIISFESDKWNSAISFRNWIECKLVDAIIWKCHLNLLLYYVSWIWCQCFNWLAEAISMSSSLSQININHQFIEVSDLYRIIQGFYLNNLWFLSTSTLIFGEGGNWSRSNKLITALTFFCCIYWYLTRTVHLELLTNEFQPKNQVVARHPSQVDGMNMGGEDMAVWQEEELRWHTKVL